MSEIYPLKFHPILVPKIWGGNKLKTILGKPSDSGNIGESWEISAVKGNESTVANGVYAGTSITGLIRQMKSDLVGKHVFETFQEEFPLLVKFIDANDNLSIQVHPNDDQAKKRHNSKGKTEMWYVIEADAGATLFSGLRAPAGNDKILSAIADGSFTSLLNMPAVGSGSAFFIPAGRIHAIKKGILLAEIQQTSDITYRLYDYGRKDANGKERELHIEESLQTIDHNDTGSGEVAYTLEKNHFSELAACNYFATNLLRLEGSIACDYCKRDSFTILICTEGTAQIRHDAETTTLKRGETVLIPAAMPKADIIADCAEIIETYIP